MACFSLAWIEQLLVWVVVIVAVVAILKLLVPFVLGQLGGAGTIVARILEIALWAFVAILVIYFAFAVISCLLSGGLPLLPHR
jgi:hypothetical protein